MTTFINLTPHPINLHLPTGEVKTIGPSGFIARVSADTTPVGEIGGMPTFRDETGAVEGLPEPVVPAAGIVWIVSGMVLSALAGTDRTDVVAPGTGPNDNPVRNEKGHVVGVTCLKVPAAR